MVSHRAAHRRIAILPPNGERVYRSAKTHRSSGEPSANSHAWNAWHCRDRIGADDMIISVAPTGIVLAINPVRRSDGSTLSITGADRHVPTGCYGVPATTHIPRSS